jgi:hypothetical protein
VYKVSREYRASWDFGAFRVSQAFKGFRVLRVFKARPTE